MSATGKTPFNPLHALNSYQNFGCRIWYLCVIEWRILRQIAFFKDGSNSISYPLLSMMWLWQASSQEVFSPHDLWLTCNQPNAVKGTLYNFQGLARKNYAASGWFSGALTFGVWSFHLRSFTPLRPSCSEEAVAKWRGHVCALLSQPAARSTTRPVSEDAFVLQLRSSPQASPQHHGAEISCLCCSLSRFLAYNVGSKIKW